MNGYCDRCANRCPADALRCERGTRRFAGGEGGFGVFGGPEAFGGSETFGGIESFGDTDDFGSGEAYGRPGGFRTLPVRPRAPMDARRGPGFGGGRGPGHGGPGGHGRGPGFGGGRPPLDGRPPRPMPAPGMLLERIAEADLPALLMMAGRMMPHRPGAGSARGQSLILSILAGREALDQRELQHMLGVQPGSLSEIVSKLERKGLVIREKGEDRRGNRLRITDAGRQAIPEAEREPEDELFSALTQAQRDALAQLLRALLTDWASKLPGGRFETLPGGPRDGFFETLPARPDAPDGPTALEERRSDGGGRMKI